MLSKTNGPLLLYLSILVLAAAFLLFGHEGFANRIINYSFPLLVITVIVYLKEVEDEI